MTTATPKKTTKAADKEVGDKFEAFRERAIATNIANDALVSDGPFILGEDHGFSTEMSIEAPSFKTRFAIDASLQSGNTIRTMSLVFGKHFDTVLDELDAYEKETGNRADSVINGIVVAYFEHFYGKDAVGQIFTKPSI